MPKVHLGDIAITVPETKRADRKPDDMIIVEHANGAKREIPANGATATVVIGAVIDIVLDAAGVDK